VCRCRPCSQQHSMQASIESYSLSLYTQSPIRLRVCNVIKMWMEKCSSQLQSDRHLLEHIHKFASKVVTGNMSLQLVRLLQQVLPHLTISSAYAHFVNCSLRSMGRADQATGWWNSGSDLLPV
jgi:hypothetical protein